MSPISYLSRNHLIPTSNTVKTLSTRWTIAIFRSILTAFGTKLQLHRLKERQLCILVLNYYCKMCWLDWSLTKVKLIEQNTIKKSSSKKFQAAPVASELAGPSSWFHANRANSQMELDLSPPHFVRNTNLLPTLQRII